jgi:hypothetical protein
MQEQQDQIESANEENLKLKSEFESLKERMKQIESLLVKGDSD